MNLESQVCSLELAKKLKELGVKQESLFYHGRIEYSPKDYHDCIFYCNTPDFDEGNTYYKDCSAFTVAELGEVISKRFNEWAQGWNDCYCQWMFQYGCRGAGQFIQGYGKVFFSDQQNEANARAELIIHLLENKLKEIPK